MLTPPQKWAYLTALAIKVAKVDGCHFPTKQILIVRQAKKKHKLEGNIQQHEDFQTTRDRPLTSSSTYVGEEPAGRDDGGS